MYFLPIIETPFLWNHWSEIIYPSYLRVCLIENKLFLQIGKGQPQCHLELLFLVDVIIRQPPTFRDIFAILYMYYQNKVKCGRILISIEILCLEAMVVCVGKTRMIHPMFMLDCPSPWVWVGIVKNPDVPSKRWKEDRWLVITQLYSMC